MELHLLGYVHTPGHLIGNLPAETAFCRGFTTQFSSISMGLICAMAVIVIFLHVSTCTQELT